MEQKTSQREFWVAAMLAVFITFLTYGILIPQLGFYRDDWYMLLSGQGDGAQGLISLFQIDRPFIGYLYAVYFRLFGITPIGWHVFALIIKMVSGIGVLWLTRLLFPKNRTEALLLTLLYIVYPGFLQQPVAATYIHLLVAVAASIYSLALTVYALRSQSARAAILASAVAAALSLLYLLIFESMIGLEAARLCIVIYILYETRGLDWKSALKKSIQWMLPYAFAAGIFLFWRVFLFKATRHSTDLDALLSDYSISPLRSALTIFTELGKDFFEMVFLSWTVPFYQFTSSGNYADLAASLFLAGLAIGALLSYRYFYQSNETNASDFPAAGIWLGVLISLLALFPINLAGRNILFSAEWDRYTLHAALGGTLLLGSLILITLKEKARVIVLFALIAAGVVTQYHSAAYYRDFWSYERALWQQMSWRAPVLKENTLLYARLAGGFGFHEDYEIYGPANLVYTPDAKVKLAADLINEKTIPLLMRQQVKGNTNRGVYIHRNYKNALILIFPTTESCLHVIDGSKVELPDFESADILYMAPYSKINRIEAFEQPSASPEKIFGAAPKADWCYYYQKISLARQQENWSEAARLADEAAQRGFQPRDKSEWIPVFEAYANTGQLVSAEQSAKKILRNRDMLTLFCSQIENRVDLPASYNYEYIFSTLCKSP